MIDGFARKCPALEVETNLPSPCVTHALEDATAVRGEAALMGFVSLRT